ncbi:MFS transporter [Nakamurella endophytica]|uniref:MFS transporter n=1 Tax=Nakamurella endophytica TaxID=1748367 RepID=A0A917STT7_9ACTN|nr:MFS transporter [Nakamurella endophytica]GGL97423.1 MFS transporter [Nakamurella endophytica]
MSEPSTGLPGFRAFPVLWTASTVGALGDGVRLVAFPLLAVSSTDDPVLVGTVAAAGSLPWLTTGLVAGALVDRWDRLRTMAVVSLARALVAAALAALLVAGATSVWVLAGAAFLLGIGQTFVDSAAQSVLPRVVGADGLDRANGRLSAGQTVAGQFAGQGLGGALFVLGPAVPVVVDAAAFLVAAVLVGRLRRAVRRPGASPGAGADGRRHVLADVAEGVRWLVGRPVLRTLLGLLAALGAASGAYWAVIALYVTSVLGVPAGWYGVVLALGAGGSLVGALCAPLVRRRLGTVGAVTLAAVVVTVVATGLGLTRDVAVAVALLTLNGIGVLTWNVVTLSLRQRRTPEELQGRVSAAFRVTGLGAMTLGSLAGGALAGAAGVPAVFLASAALVAVVSAVAIPAVRRGGADGDQAAPADPAGGDVPGWAHDG